MNLTLEHAGRRWRVRADRPHDLSIPLDFYGEVPTAFFVPRAEARPVQVGTFVGDVRRGGSVNCDLVTFSPHASGTHTECVGHVTESRIAVRDVVGEALVAASVVTVTPVVMPVSRFREDTIVTAEVMREALVAVDRDFADALVVRTMPNEPDKRMQSYSGTNPPYLAAEAVRLIRALGVRHLLVDLPSIDRERDEGALAAHRVFWGLPEGGRTLNGTVPPGTITEMIYVDDSIPDGRYVLNLQVAPFQLDAAPSRPLLFGVEELGAA